MADLIPNCGLLLYSCELQAALAAGSITDILVIRQQCPMRFPSPFAMFHLWATRDPAMCTILLTCRKTLTQYLFIVDHHHEISSSNARLMLIRLRGFLSTVYKRILFYKSHGKGRRYWHETVNSRTGGHREISIPLVSSRSKSTTTCTTLSLTL